MDFLILKWIHILSAILMFGTGLGSAFYKYFTDRSGNLAAIAVTNRLVVWADWIFTTPTVLIQPLTGFWMLQLLGVPLDQQWLWISVGLYVIAGACWLPVVVLQIRMRDEAEHCIRSNSRLSPRYYRSMRYWFWLGVPAFVAMLLVTWLMVGRPLWAIF